VYILLKFKFNVNKLIQSEINPFAKVIHANKLLSKSFWSGLLFLEKKKIVLLS